MNSRTFNAWLKALGYSWSGEEQMMKGFMTEGEARSLISEYESRGLIKRG